MSFNFFRPIVQTNYSTDLYAVKYAPKRLENVAGQQQIVQTFIKYRQEQNMPNLIITGPPGSGKKTTVDLLAKSFLGAQYDEAHFKVEGAIDRGKHVVTENSQQSRKRAQSSDTNITDFLKRKTSLAPNRFKIITINDFDHMTTEAQMALRRIIETQSNRVRFIFIANDCQNIIEAIQSRCVIIKFDAISGPEILPVLEWIVEQETKPTQTQPPKGLKSQQPQPPTNSHQQQSNSQQSDKITPELLELIILAAYGDLKQSIIYLQVMMNASNEHKPDSTDQFYQIFGLPQLPRIRALLAACYRPKGSKAYQLLQELLDDGYTADDLIDILYKIVLLNIFKIDPARQHLYLEAIADAAYKTEYTGTNHHLYAMISDFIKN